MNNPRCFICGKDNEQKYIHVKNKLLCLFCYGKGNFKPKKNKTMKEIVRINEGNPNELAAAWDEPTNTYTIIDADGKSATFNGSQITFTPRTFTIKKIHSIWAMLIILDCEINPGKNKKTKEKNLTK